ncbi:hypothetical protein [Cupriavidus sp. UBA2534]|uniref:hypothetical protein n=1 Tax=Cupriavidus sp. UBA2534 TaxID=1946399 RepID=UPI00257F0EA0|nr:hypothetical protein [Cupriavidus sp. UBA2534]
MYQIDNSTAATTQPASTAAGTAGFFTDGNPATSTPATILPAEWLNSVMMELVNVVSGGGVTPTKNQFNNVLSAIKRIGQNTIVLADTGAANAYTATNSTPLVVGTWVDGVLQAVKIAHANTGASTYSPDGLTAIPIYGLGLQPLQGGELALNGTAILMRLTIPGVNSGNSICVLMECAGGAQQVAPATQSQHAMQLGQATGRLLNIQYFTSSGTYTPSPGTTSIIVEAVGGGGAGGGATSAASNVSAGGSGSAGGWGYKRITSGFSGASVTIGAKGTGVAGAAGGNGTTTSFGAFLSVLGGGGGGAGVAAAVVGIAGSVGAASGVGAGADVGASGQVGNPGVILSPTSGFGGVGAVSRFGSGGLVAGLNGTGVTAGGNASGFGASGSGAIGVNNGATAAGGNGAPGLIIVYEYA